MTAEVQDILIKLAEIERLILDPVSGSAIRAYEEVPYTVSVADMPLVINYAGPLSENRLMGSDEQAIEYNEYRTYDLVLYHSAYASGIEGEKYGLLAPYFRLFYETFGARPHLGGVGDIVNAKLVRDTGAVGTVQFAGQNYYGIRFTLQVIGRARRQLAPSE